MKLFFLFLLFVFCFCRQSSVPRYNVSFVKEIFKEFSFKYNKIYATEEEFLVRLDKFRNNLILINELNERQSSAVYGITKYADLSPEEFSAQYLNYKRTYSGTKSYLKFDKKSPIPINFDWRDKGVVTAVKDQGSCGSCWAFSATEGIESQWKLAGNKLVELSPQQIVDCDKGRGDEGCNGGDLPTAFAYVIDAGGMETESVYPYTGEDDTCSFNSKDVVASIKNWTYITKDKDENEMMVGLYNSGPLSICVDAESWQFYIEGVITDFCGTNLDHCVQITGYSNYTSWDTEVYQIWLIRNSWGADWGENGYVYVERGYDLCGVAEEVIIPLVKNKKNSY